MAAVVVAILDRDEWGANTDVLVVVDRWRRRLTWVPRDLWVESLDHRVNKAFARGGGEGVLRALEELGFRAQSVVCLRRAASEAALEGVSVTVPVTEPLDFWYPLHPTELLEDGRVEVSFRPPEETLTGVRIHQWVGARMMVNGQGTDFHRLRRQAVLVRALLTQGYDFRRALADPNLVRITGPDPMRVLRRVTPRWRMEVFDEVVDAERRGWMVLLRRPHRPWWRRLLSWGRRTLRPT